IIANDLSLAELYIKLNDLDSARYYANIVEYKLLNSRNQFQGNFPKLYNDLAGIYSILNDKFRAMRYYILSDSIETQFYIKNSDFLSEVEMNEYIESRLNSNNERLSFFSLNADLFKNISGIVIYNNILNSKSFMLDNKHALNNYFSENGDTLNTNIYLKWKRK
ncbi:MAG: hypothetical protein IPO85_18135, partial [Saprospiraceae bacterium]|nr:hypothetical protein [Candidatus Defluviibacterium haderslevense]